MIPILHAVTNHGECFINDQCFVLTDKYIYNDDRRITEDPRKFYGLEQKQLGQIPLGAVYLTRRGRIWSLAINVKPAVSLIPDYSGTQWRAHKIQQRYKTSILGKALGHGNKVMLDACAGFGRDSIILSALGCKVTACERNPIVFLLLRQAINGSRFSDIEVINNDSIDLLDERNEWPLIYLDPMFDNYGKAQVKKPTLFLRTIVAQDNNCDIQLFHKARKSCRRLIVKRHIHAPALAGISADLQYRGKSTRYDIYL